MARVLRPYQQSCTSQVRSLWDRDVNKVILVLPTGGGKTECALSLSEPFKNPLSVCHTRILADQLNQRLCLAATWQGLRKQGKWPNGTPDLLVVDEVHVGDSPDWQHVFEMVPPETKILGLTATPWRFSHGTNVEKRCKNNRYGKGLGDLFDAMIVGVRPRELVRDGYLVPLKVLNIVEAQDAAARLKGMVGPSFNPKTKKYTGRITSNSEERLDIVDAWVRHGENRKTIVFTHLVPAAERACQSFLAMGIRCSVVHGGIPAKECNRRLEAFKRNETRVLINVMQLTCGVDVPDVGCLVIDRGCNNLNTYLQVCGRGARTAPGKTDCLILDLTGCSVEHGDPQKDQDYWIVTSEGRPVSELACEVCGTRLSPMFPTRCMRCDPFKPKLGDPKELLDTGMRVYSAIKDLGPDPSDELIIAVLESFRPETDTEGEVWVHEVESAKKRIQAKRDAEAAALRRLEAEARAREAAAAAEAVRVKQAADWRAKLEAQQAHQRARLELQQAHESELRAQQSQATALSPEELDEFKRALWQRVTLFVERGWSLSTAVRDVRQSLSRYAGKYERENFHVPEELQKVLAMVDGYWAKKHGQSLAKYELDRMMADPRTNKYGAAWCRKKVRQLFGESDVV
jgi:ATP-dependent helicase IRC3